MFPARYPAILALYCSSVTCSSQVTCLPSRCSCNAICIIAVSGPAPCQCFPSGAIHTVSPGRISRTGPPHSATRPTPEITCKVWPSGWVCHAVRARGSKRTKAPRMRAGAGASMIGSCHTVPVKESAGARREGTEPNGLISMADSFLLLAGVVKPYPSNRLHSLGFPVQSLRPSHYVVFTPKGTRSLLPALCNPAGDTVRDHERRGAVGAPRLAFRCWHPGISHQNY